MRAEEPPAHGARSVVAVPGARYGASRVFQVFFGGRWRDDWTTAVEVPELDLSTFDGGLRPVGRRGGQQTTNLVLESANGGAWVFRPVDKDARRMLSPALRESVAGELFRDLTSTSQHPVGGLVVPPLAEAAGVLHTRTALIVVPDDPRLGEFRDFAGTLGLIESYVGRGFAGSDAALGSLELFDRLGERAGERVDARAYLRARLLDLLVGDWDRHAEQWRWLRFAEGGRPVWRPVPLDRDEAFSRFDGVLLTIGEYYTKSLVTFDDGYPAIDKLTFGGRYTDRRFLAGLSVDEWRAVTADVAARVTDDVIAAAVGRLPPELRARDGELLGRALRARRDALPQASDAFYRLLAREVDVYGTHRAELASIRRSRDGGLELTLSALDEGTGGAIAPRPPLFHRSFRAGETREIRLYLLGGADRVVQAGEDGGRIRVRVVRDDPAVAAERRAAATALAEAPAGDGADAPPAPRGDAEERRRVARHERFRDWGTDVLVYPELAFDATRGLVAGARLERTHYGFARDPFADRMDFAAAWSTGLSAPRLEYKLDLRTSTRLGGLLYAAYSGMDYANFFGVGNDTSRDGSLASDDFYRVDQDRYVLRPLVTAILGGPALARAGFALERFDNSADRETSPASRLYGSGTMNLASLEAGLNYDTRGGILTHRRGFGADVGVQWYPSVLDNDSGFTKLRGEVAALLGSPFASPVLLGLRLAGEKIWGDHPYFESASIGGGDLPSPLDVASGSTGNLLRGYDLNRFSGDASVVANADLRVPLGTHHAIVPLRYGLLALADVGRVFVDGDGSSTWHPAVGGGVWVAMRAAGKDMDYVSAVSLAVVRSDERTSLQLTSAFGF